MSAYDYQERVETARLNAARAVTRALGYSQSGWTAYDKRMTAEAFPLLQRCAAEVRASQPFDVIDAEFWRFAQDCIAAWIAVDAWRRAVAGQ